MENQAVQRRRGRPPMNRATVAPSVANDAPLPLPEAENRPAMRAPMREDDPHVRAAKRAAELRDHLGTMDEGTDEFYISPDDEPEGWKYNWKRKSSFGKEDPAYQVHLARRGWEAVPASRHPSYMPEGTTSEIIERKGMVLMEIPLEIYKEMQKIELKRARDQVRQKEAQLNSAPEGQFARANKDSPLVKIHKSYEAIPIPQD